MNIDSYFEKGKSHDICEDYTLHGQHIASFNNNLVTVPYIIVCDGCSSSPNTDFGARILAHAYKKALEDSLNYGVITNNREQEEIESHMKQETIFNLKSSLLALRLKNEIADCTLMACFIYGERIFICCYGDGYIYINYSPDLSEIICMEYTENAPFYLTYNLDMERKNKYAECFPDNRFKVRRYYIRPNQKMQILDTNFNNFDKSFWRETTSSDENIQSITMFSDGIASYQFSPRKSDITELNKKELETIPKILQAVDYKGVQGEFVKRKMKRLKRDFDNDLIENFDDVSVASIIL